MGLSERRKGHGFERKVAVKMRTCGFPLASRLLEYQAQEANGIDLSNTGDWDIQCKNMKKVPNIPSVFREIHGTGKKVIIFSVTNKGEYAAVELETFLELMRSYESNIQKNDHLYEKGPTGNDAETSPGKEYKRIEMDPKKNARRAKGCGKME
jgi:hypothetical protein